MNKKQFNKAVEIYGDQIKNDFKEGKLDQEQFTLVNTYFKAFVDFLNWIKENNK